MKEAIAIGRQWENVERKREGVETRESDNNAEYNKLQAGKQALATSKRHREGPLNTSCFFLFFFILILFSHSGFIVQFNIKDYHPLDWDF